RSRHRVDVLHVCCTHRLGRLGHRRGHPPTHLGHPQPPRRRSGAADAQRRHLRLRGLGIPGPGSAGSPGDRGRRRLRDTRRDLLPGLGHPSQQQHPEGSPMTGQAQTTDYDLIVIGAGSTGENVADYATKRGVRVAIIEDELVGGECSYWACMPSKALLRSGHALRAARRLAGAKEAVTGDLDAAALLARRTSFTDGWSDEGQAAWVESAGMELIRGRGRLVGPGRIQVGDRVITAKAVAVATGSVPVFPPIPGLADAAPWGTREATSADSVPERIIVIGGGVAGTELAFAFSSLGSQVTMLSRSALLEREEPFAGKYVTAALAADGVDVRIGPTP